MTSNVEIKELIPKSYLVEVKKIESTLFGSLDSKKILSFDNKYIILCSVHIYNTTLGLQNNLRSSKPLNLP